MADPADAGTRSEVQELKQQLETVQDILQGTAPDPDTQDLVQTFMAECTPKYSSLQQRAEEILERQRSGETAEDLEILFQDVVEAMDLYNKQERAFAEWSGKIGGGGGGASDSAGAGGGAGSASSTGPKASTALAVPAGMGTPPPATGGAGPGALMDTPTAIAAAMEASAKEAAAAAGADADGFPTFDMPASGGDQTTASGAATGGFPNVTAPDADAGTRLSAGGEKKKKKKKDKKKDRDAGAGLDAFGFPDAFGDLPTQPSAASTAGALPAPSVPVATSSGTGNTMPAAQAAAEDFFAGFPSIDAPAAAAAPAAAVAADSAASAADKAQKKEKKHHKKTSQGGASGGASGPVQVSAAGPPDANGNLRCVARCVDVDFDQIADTLGTDFFAESFAEYLAAQCGVPRDRIRIKGVRPVEA